MDFHLSEIPSQQQIYQTYDDERRLRISRFAAPVFGLVTVFFLIIMTTYTVAVPKPKFINVVLPPGLVVAGLITLGVGATIYFYGTYAAFHNNARTASRCVVIGLLINTLIGANLWIYTQGLGPFVLGCMILLALDIVVVGILSDTVTLILCTLLMNAFIISITIFAPRDPHMVAPLEREGMLMCIGNIALQWCFTGIMIGSSQAQRRTLQQLGDVQLAYERAKQLDAIKDQFIRSVNHELRNPVMALSGYVRLLQHQGDQLSRSTQREFIDRANRAGARLISLLNRILATSQLEQQAQDYTPETVNLKEVVIEAAQSIDPAERQLNEQILQIDVAPDFTVWADRIRLLQVFTNVLSNAAKYSPPAARVNVSACVVEEVERDHHKKNTTSLPTKYAEIRVHDQGLGIPPEQIPLLFKRFVRLPRDLMSSVSGSGLGLYICQTIVEAMHGKIWVESTGVAGEGTTVCMQLPVASADAVAQVPATAGRA
jgi:signal transduction histidine kinase